MSPELLDGYLNAGRALSPAADWAIDTVLYLGPGCLFIGACLAIWEGLDKARRLVREVQQAAPSERDALTELAELEAHFNAYAARIDHLYPREEKP